MRPSGGTVESSIRRTISLLIRALINGKKRAQQFGVEIDHSSRLLKLSLLGDQKLVPLLLTKSIRVHNAQNLFATLADQKKEISGKAANCVINLLQKHRLIGGDAARYEEARQRVAQS